MVGVKVGSLIGGYRILGSLGQGGMGHVLLARQESLDRAVALKVLSPDLAATDERFGNRFMAEAKMVAKLTHPNIVSIFDVGEALHEGHKILYFSMEYIKGENCRQLVERNGVPDLKLVQQLMGSVSEALAYAHRLEMVHRDIKPDNIMMTHTGQVKLADFGLAFQRNKHVDSGLNSECSINLEGTPHFMSPEQVLRREPTPQCDVYSLGATLYYILTGSPPYRRSTVKEAMRAHVHAEVPDPGDELACPSAWRELCMRMMSKDPRVRPQSHELPDEINRAAEKTTAIHRHRSRLARNRPQLGSKPVGKTSVAREKAKRGVILTVICAITLLFALFLFQEKVVGSSRDASKVEQAHASTKSLEADESIMEELSPGDQKYAGKGGEFSGRNNDTEFLKDERVDNLSGGAEPLVAKNLDSDSAKGQGSSFRSEIDPVDKTSVFIEQDGIVVVELENLLPADGWTMFSLEADFLGAGYVQYTGPINLEGLHSDGLQCRMEIKQLGLYSLRFRSRNGPNARSDGRENDSWVSVAGGARLIGQQDHGSSFRYHFNEDIAKFSVFSKRGWSWRTRTLLKIDGKKYQLHQLFIEFDEPGVYSIMIGGRSPGHRIDRFVLFHQSVKESSALDEGLVESPRRR